MHHFLQIMFLLFVQTLGVFSVTFQFANIFDF